MQTQQIIQASANVIRITQIKKGDIYKRFEDSEDQPWLGIVQAVYNDGTKAVIEAIEYKKQWNDEIKVKQVSLKGTKDYTIFPATISDFEMEFGKVIEEMERKINDAEKTIANSRNTIEFTKKLCDGTLQKELQTPQFTEMSQKEFNEKIEALNM